VKDKLQVAVKIFSTECTTESTTPDSSAEDDFFETMDGAFIAPENSKEDLDGSLACSVACCCLRGQL
jgi:hypothetical protein